MIRAERLQKLRRVMAEKGIDAYLIPTDDYHCSEYVGDFFKGRNYITGFSGSAGTAVIFQDMAGLWTDGRYFIQAAEQLSGSEIRLFKMGEPEVPEVDDFLEKKLEKGQTLGFDGKCMAALHGEKLQKSLEKKGVQLCFEEDLLVEIWEDRPALSCEPVMELPLLYAGKSREEKIQEIRQAMDKEGADAFLLTSLEDIAWLLNIRGGDIHCCPVVLAYLLLEADSLRLYTNEKAFSKEQKETLEQAGVTFCCYGQVYDDVKKLAAGKTLLLDKNKVNYSLTALVPEDVKVLDRQNLTLLPKSIKNPTEVENIRKAHSKDGVAVTKFIYWLKKNVGKEQITELSAAEKLEELRKEQENFMGNSFDPIIAYGPHAAIVHYSATRETNVPLEAKGMLLADTGGHYLEGSTDITRTIVLGETTEKERKYFTAVLRGHLNLSAVTFKYGCTGLNLDYIARQPLWELGEDYNHGTGHGVGYLLSVHEGPNGFRWKQVGSRPAAVLEEGMVTSNEPGYYLEGEFGIRHENLTVCKQAEKTAYGQFMVLENLTLVPFDLEAVEPSQMSAGEIRLLNQYHRMVFEKISPYLNEEEQEWLKEATREIE